MPHLLFYYKNLPAIHHSSTTTFLLQTIARRQQFHLPLFRDLGYKGASGKTRGKFGVIPRSTRVIITVGCLVYWGRFVQIQEHLCTPGCNKGWWNICKHFLLCYNLSQFQNLTKGMLSWTKLPCSLLNHLSKSIWNCKLNIETRETYWKFTIVLFGSRSLILLSAAAWKYRYAQSPL